MTQKPSHQIPMNLYHQTIEGILRPILPKYCPGTSYMIIYKRSPIYAMESEGTVRLHPDSRGTLGWLTRSRSPSPLEQFPG